MGVETNPAIGRSVRPLKLAAVRDKHRAGTLRGGIVIGRRILVWVVRSQTALTVGNG